MTSPAGGFGGLRHGDHGNVSAGGGRVGKYTAECGDERRSHARNGGVIPRQGLQFLGQTFLTDSSGVEQSVSMVNSRPQRLFLGLSA